MKNKLDKIVFVIRNIKKKLLLKLAHYIIQKYSVIPLELKDKVLFNGIIFEIQSYTLERDFFKTDLTIDMCDCLKLIDK